MIFKDLLLDDRMDSLRKFLHRNKDTFDFNGPDNGVPIHKFQKIKKNGSTIKDDLFSVGGHGNHLDYTERMAQRILEAKNRFKDNTDGLDQEIYDIIKEVRSEIKKKVVSTGETAEKVNDIIF